MRCRYISGDLPAVMTGSNATNPSFVPWTWSGVTSLCHPWAAGPAYWMSINLLGVRPTPGSAGFQVYTQCAVYQQLLCVDTGRMLYLLGTTGIAVVLTSLNVWRRCGCVVFQSVEVRPMLTDSLAAVKGVVPSLLGSFEVGACIAAMAILHTRSPRTNFTCGCYLPTSIAVLCCAVRRCRLI
jgi:hypothetical protein